VVVGEFDFVGMAVLQTLREHSGDLDTGRRTPGRLPTAAATGVP